VAASSVSLLCLPQSAKFQTFMALDYRAGAAIMLVSAFTLNDFL